MQGRCPICLNCGWAPCELTQRERAKAFLNKKPAPKRSAFLFSQHQIPTPSSERRKTMETEKLTKIDIVKIHMVKDGTIEYGKRAIRNPKDLADLGMKFLKHADREIFLLVCLNTRNQINCIHVVSIGTVNASLVAPREVFKIALLSNASEVAFIHNHVSGDVEPSEDDLLITKRLAECGKLFDIKLLDHVIISDEGKYESFLERGLIKQT